MVKRATPFVVVSNGKYRQIFSIVEKPSGELTVILRGGESVADGMHPTSPSVLNELRISIHLSKDSAKNGRTIKETVTIDGGTTKTSAAFIKDSSEDLLWPVKSLLCHDLDDPRYDISKKINSPVIICENYPKKWQLYTLRNRCRMAEQVQLHSYPVVEITPAAFAAAVSALERYSEFPDEIHWPEEEVVGAIFSAMARANNQDFDATKLLRKFRAETA